jgi:4a-hydroxytetrahydrobiopterin dehydratase
MATGTLLQKRCIPCEGGGGRLSSSEIGPLLAQLTGWSCDGERLRQEFRHRDFAEAMRFVNRMAELAESEGHHPDFCVQWNRVAVTVWTHSVGGLTENDFVLAAKIGPLAQGGATGPAAAGSADPVVP